MDKSVCIYPAFTLHLPPSWAVPIYRDGTDSDTGFTFWSTYLDFQDHETRGYTAVFFCPHQETRAGTWQLGSMWVCPKMGISNLPWTWNKQICLVNEHKYGKSAFLMRQLRISTAIFNGYFDITRLYICSCLSIVPLSSLLNHIKPY